MDSLSPDSGGIEGGYQVTITGYGFNFTAAETSVHVGYYTLTGDTEISVVDENTITVLSMPSEVLGIPVAVSVETPVGESNTVSFTYVNGVPIEFSRGLLYELYAPTTLAFGPVSLICFLRSSQNCSEKARALSCCSLTRLIMCIEYILQDGKLYIGTIDGKIAKLTLTEDLDDVVEVLVSTVVSPTNRIILGIAFDPLSSQMNPPVYFSHSKIFHGDSTSSSGLSINGKISYASGSNLDIVVDLITGLPVSDHDHALNGLEFGDHGELYFLVGGNTNAGVPGALSSSQEQKENVLSAAALVADLSDPSFNGFLTYDAVDDGNLNPGFGVEVFAAGLRNPYDLVLHSNGKIYATDNGPNDGYGFVSTSCNQFGLDIEEEVRFRAILYEKEEESGNVADSLSHCFPPQLIETG